jgi:ribosomal protein L11 methyltransferase
MSHVYIEYSFRVEPKDPGTEILLAELAELPFESFEETDFGLKAYVRKPDWSAAMLEHVELLNSPAFVITYESSEIPPENWNEKWETHFEPIEIDERCRVRAPFHPKKEVRYDIVIEPKMSFGTGHHETTHMMLEFLLDLEIEGKTVLDMGCGTAVLAILAGMKGAAEIEAIDIDHWSFLNAMENAKRNGQERIRIFEGDSSVIPDTFYNLILANINRNVLLNDIPVYSDRIKEGGILLLSGFYDSDLDLISEQCSNAGMNFVSCRRRNTWVAAQYQKPVKKD